MRSSAVADIVSLDEFRSRRDERRLTPRAQSVPVPAYAPAVWVYWVPVWVW